MMGTTVNVAILADLVSQLRNAGNWCGETHVQKNVTERHGEESIEAQAKRVNELRPYVSVEIATEALKELDESPTLH